MITKKKSVFVLLSLMLILSACGGSSETTTEEVAEPAAEQETLDSPATKRGCSSRTALTETMLRQSLVKQKR